MGTILRYSFAIYIYRARLELLKKPRIGLDMKWWQVGYMLFTNPADIPSWAIASQPRPRPVQVHTNICLRHAAVFSFYASSVSRCGQRDITGWYPDGVFECIPCGLLSWAPPKGLELHGDIP
jgi:hypothetical protein